MVAKRKGGGDSYKVKVGNRIHGRFEFEVCGKKDSSRKKERK